ncbi:MAG: glutamate 5-kinase [Cyanobacteria bacterium SIG31]|nr:glutamate 5-kinase [Cyanobacteria bacterium SIG31]
MQRKDFIDVKRIVIKLGTNVLRNEDGEVAVSRIYSFIEDISKLIKNGKEVIVVTSGAVGLGKKKLNLDSTDGDGIKQACAAVGQSRLMSYYEAGFAGFDIPVAQILLTEDDFSMRHRYLSLRTTLNKLIELGVVPIINQNDTVSTIELNDMLSGMQVCFSDNDKLSALVASELDADLLILLSDIDGLYNANPKENPEAEFIREVECVNDEILGLGSGASDGGRGGMKTKLEAAKLVTRFGGKVLIANGKVPYVINKIFSAEEIGTMFVPSNENLSGKKRWIGYATNIRGKLIVNSGAKNAIIDRCTSLLPIGIIEVINDFKQGEVVSICDESGVEFARGMVNYDSNECSKIAGAHSDSILEILGYKNYDAVITRDNITNLD